jgi:hypothetical protein
LVVRPLSSILTQKEPLNGKKPLKKGRLTENRCTTTVAAQGTTRYKKEQQQV